MNVSSGLCLGVRFLFPLARAFELKCFSSCLAPWRVAACPWGIMKAPCVVLLTLAVLTLLTWLPVSLSCNKALCASDVSKCLIQVWRWAFTVTHVAKQCQVRVFTYAECEYMYIGFALRPSYRSGPRAACVAHWWSLTPTVLLHVSRVSFKKSSYCHSPFNILATTRIWSHCSVELNGFLVWSI